jgi:hypothetical protein
MKKHATRREHRLGCKYLKSKFAGQYGKERSLNAVVSSAAELGHVAMERSQTGCWIYLPARPGGKTADAPAA